VAEVVFNSLGADEEPRCRFAVGSPIGYGHCDLQFLRRQLVGGSSSGSGYSKAGRIELGSRPVGPRFGTQLEEGVEGWRKLFSGSSPAAPSTISRPNGSSEMLG
jgi:hypothetical protein